MSGSIHEVKFKPDPADDDVVAMLELWLERAKNGEVQAIALVGVRPGNFVATEWKGISNGHFHALNSGVATLQHRLCASDEE